jgi:DNA-binding SARP family transcriptional activator
VSRRKPGYVLNLDPEHLDLHRFERLAREGGQALPSSPDRAAVALGEALSLWRGAPLAEFTEEPFAQTEVPRLQEQRLNALTMRVRADLALGRHAQLVGELEDLTARHPLHEGFRGQLILSLYRAGRQGEALEAYRRARRVLADELGIEPTRELQDLEAGVLAHDPQLDWALPSATTAAVVAQPVAQHIDRASRRPRVSNLPARNPRFTGRAALLDQLHHQVQARSDILVVQALYGLGGVGKTQLVIEYAHRYAVDYDIIWWIDAEQAVLIPDQFLRLATRLGLATDAVAGEVVHRVLTELGSRTGWLLIFDNAENPGDIAEYRPRGPGQVLVTSRYPGWGAMGSRLEVDVLDRSDTVALLRARIPDMTVELAHALAAELGDLPLAAAQAVGYIEQTGMPSAEYLRRFHTHRAALLADGEVLGYESRVDTTWAISLERLHASSPAAVALLELSAFLAPEPIPFTLFNDHPDHLDEPLRTLIAGDPDALADVVGAMVGFSLVRRHPDGFQLHRLLQAVIRNRIPRAAQERLIATDVALLAAAYPGDPNEPASWAGYARLAPHILATGPLGDHHQNFRHLLLRTITYLSDTGHPETARSIAHELFERWQRVLGPDHLDTLTAAASLTAVLIWLGEHTQARVIGDDALRRAQRELGPDHPVTLRLATSQTARTWLVPEAPAAQRESSNSKQTDSHDAALQRALLSLGPDHPITLGISLLAITQRMATLALPGDTATLYSECRDALRRAGNRLGPHHPTTLGLAADLGLILLLLGDAEKARVIAEETVRRSRRRPGPDHFVTLHASTVLAFVTAQHGDAEQAHALGEEILKRCRNQLGPDHLITLCAAAAVTISLVRLGAKVQAQTLGQDVLAASENRLGPDHPITRTLTHMLPLNHTQSDHIPKVGMNH